MCKRKKLLWDLMEHPVNIRCHGTLSLKTLIQVERILKARCKEFLWKKIMLCSSAPIWITQTYILLGVK
jgi:hypothetical protein